MSRTRSLLAVLLAAAFAALPNAQPTSAQPPAKARKVAFLVGVGAFKHDLDDLKGRHRRTWPHSQTCSAAAGSRWSC